MLQILHTTMRNASGLDLHGGRSLLLLYTLYGAGSYSTLWKGSLDPGSFCSPDPVATGDMSK